MIAWARIFVGGAMIGAVVAYLAQAALSYGQVFLLLVFAVLLLSRRHA